jgi:hypothetical protein
MTLAKRKYHMDKKGGVRHLDGGSDSYEYGAYAWPNESDYSLNYDYEEELCDHIYRFPAPAQVEDICAVLRISTLRELSTEIANGGIEHIKGNTTRLEYARLVNSWLATAEETVAAGKNVKRISDRRRGKS